MTVHLEVRNESSQTRLYRRDVLRRLAERMCAGEGAREGVELSVLFCDDDFIRQLNQRYRRQNRATDVLSFAQPDGILCGVRVLGDIVISLETVERNCGGDRCAMREEVRLLFCHGLLHLFGHEHASAAGRQRMTEKQARYLDISKEAAWRSEQRA